MSSKWTRSKAVQVSVNLRLKKIKARRNAGITHFKCHLVYIFPTFYRYSDINRHTIHILIMFFFFKQEKKN